jgi:hypothetical protein
VIKQLQLAISYCAAAVRAAFGEFAKFVLDSTSGFHKIQKPPHGLRGGHAAALVGRWDQAVVKRTVALALGGIGASGVP